MWVIPEGRQPAKVFWVCSTRPQPAPLPCASACMPQPALHSPAPPPAHTRAHAFPFSPCVSYRTATCLTYLTSLNLPNLAKPYSAAPPRPATRNPRSRFAEQQVQQQIQALKVFANILGPNTATLGGQQAAAAANGQAGGGGGGNGMDVSAWGRAVSVGVGIPNVGLA